MSSLRNGLDRRMALQGGMMAAVFAALPATAKPAAGNAGGLSGLLASFAEEILRLSPETATSIGVDTGVRARLRGRLSEVSAADNARWAQQARSMVQRLQQLDRAQLGNGDRVHYDTVLYAAQRGVEGTAFSYGGAAGGFFGQAVPYVVTQQDGALTAIPDFLDSQHPVVTAADADYYLQRMQGLARLLDQETGRLRAQAAAGVMPPDFIAANALGQMKAYRATAPAQQQIIRSLVTRAGRQGLKGSWEQRATRILLRQIYPALDRQIAAFETATRGAPSAAGVQRLPDGEAYYRWALRLGTTTSQSPSEIHKLGLEQNRDIQARMDALLVAQGLTQGSVGARVQALNGDPRFLYPNTDAGREALIAYLNDRVAAMRPLLARLSHLKLKADLVIKRVPPDIQDGASLGYMNFASLDGSRPAIYYVNLKSTDLWPKYQLATLTAHEGVPGHAWQGAYLAEHSKDVPLISSLMGFNAFAEGWALYAEQLVDEAGLYADDPFARLGYLQAQQFRACRLVVDTGLHAMGWSRAQAVDFLVAETGRGNAAMTSETDRYCVSPGQACGYKMGHNEILRLREQARTALGTAFDLAAFNDAVVTTGGVPLEVLSKVIDDFVVRSQTA